MLRSAWTTVLLVAILAAWCPGTSADESADESTEAIKAMLREYIQAFNRADTEAIGGFWTEDAVWQDDETGERISGREAIATDYAQFFAESPDARLSGEIAHLKHVADTVATLEGLAYLMLRDAEPIESAFSAVVIKQGDTWRFSSVHESELPAGEAEEQLKQLDSMVGQWVDDIGWPRVNTTVRWGTDRSFLIRSYVVEEEDGTVSQGTQVIGWDPRQHRIRSWTFESDGSFGEATWSKDGSEWVGRMRHTLTDGGISSATQIIREVDRDTLEVRTVGLEVDGQPQPSADPVRVLRVEEPQTDPPSDATISPAEQTEAEE